LITIIEVLFLNLYSFEAEGLVFLNKTGKAMFLRGLINFPQFGLVIFENLDFIEEMKEKVKNGD